MVSPQQKQAAVGDLQKQGLSMRTSCILVQVERKGFYYKPKFGKEKQQITNYLKETKFNNVCPEVQ